MQKISQSTFLLSFLGVIDKKLQIIGNLKRNYQAGVTFAWLPMTRVIRYESSHANTSITCYVSINGLKRFMGDYFSVLPFPHLCVFVCLDFFT